MNELEQFKNQKYLNIETFRKSGIGVKTPVWFVQDAGEFYIQTLENSGKVKRIRNNPNVNITPCRVDGQLLGDWVAADAMERTDTETALRVEKLLNKKYGLMKKFFALSALLKKRKNTILQVVIDSSREKISAQ